MSQSLAIFLKGQTCMLNKITLLNPLMLLLLRPKLSLGCTFINFIELTLISTEVIFRILGQANFFEFGVALRYCLAVHYSVDVAFTD